MDYTDNVLIKLRRKYSKDETIAALSKKISELEIEKGKLSSEIEHLQYQNEKDFDNKEIMKLAKIEARKEKLYLLKVNENKKMREENIALRKYRSELLNEVSVLKKKKLTNQLIVKSKFRIFNKTNNMTEQEQIQNKINDLNTCAEKTDKHIYSFMVESEDKQDFSFVTLKIGIDGKWVQSFD